MIVVVVVLLVGKVGVTAGRAGLVQALNRSTAIAIRMRGSASRFSKFGLPAATAEDLNVDGLFSLSAFVILDLDCYRDGVCP